MTISWGLMKSIVTIIHERSMSYGVVTRGRHQHGRHGGELVVRQTVLNEGRAWRHDDVAGRRRRRRRWRTDSESTLRAVGLSLGTLQREKAASVLSSKPHRSKSHRGFRFANIWSNLSIFSLYIVPFIDWLLNRNFQILAPKFCSIFNRRDSRHGRP